MTNLDYAPKPRFATTPPLTHGWPPPSPPRLATPPLSPLMMSTNPFFKFLFLALVPLLSSALLCFDVLCSALLSFRATLLYRLPLDVVRVVC